MRSIDGLTGCRKICTCILQLSENTWGRGFLKKQFIRQSRDLEVSSYSYGWCSSRKFSKCPEFQAFIRLSMQSMVQLLSTDEETLWSFCFLRLLLVAGDGESMVRGSLSDEAFKFSVHRHLICNTKPTPQHLDTDSGKIFPAGFWVMS